MFHKSRGIVLHSIKYSDSSLIVKIYTENFGLQSYILRSARNRKSKMKVGIFQPLALLNFVVSHNKKRGL
ncbi:MAG: recombination protein O N-terminal domain-containing protein, partial [Bacteroidales bacterium]